MKKVFESIKDKVRMSMRNVTGDYEKSVGYIGRHRFVCAKAGSHVIFFILDKKDREMARISEKVERMLND